ncbi:transmembrane protein 192-like [Corticium candelabrum]|uniref:transmembrane protein 192-like n=1 Tax=Corticium candelabrum TaxID=121492 RepID=UPI002E266A2E|nr:transmembrane protein 192-like [Corticium candelabrum]
MVSLNDRSHRGAFFLGDQDVSRDATPVSVADQRLVLSDGRSQFFNRLNTEWLAVSEAVILVVYEISLFVCGHLGVPTWPSSSANVKSQETSLPFQFFVMLHGFVWFGLFIGSRIKQFLHQKSRQCGYLSFYRNTRSLRRIPLYTISCGSALLLIAMSVVGTPTRAHPSFISIKYIYLLGIFTLIENVIVLPALVLYIVRVGSFNKKRLPADVEEDLLETRTADLSDLGFTNGEYTDEILEKQADMIRYLQQHNADLGRRILQLTSNTGH